MNKIASALVTGLLVAAIAPAAALAAPAASSGT